MKKKSPRMITADVITVRPFIYNYTLPVGSTLKAVYPAACLSYYLINCVDVVFEYPVLEQPESELAFIQIIKNCAPVPQLSEYVGSCVMKENYYHVYRRRFETDPLIEEFKNDNGST